MLGEPESQQYHGYSNYPVCPKVIHKTKGYGNIRMGNHAVRMKNPVMIRSTDINLYHYSNTNYRRYEEKILRYLESVPLMKKGIAIHMRAPVDAYKKGTLKEIYEKGFNNKEEHEFLMRHGIISIDPSVYNFLKYKGLLPVWTRNEEVEQ